MNRLNNALNTLRAKSLLELVLICCGLLLLISCGADTPSSQMISDASAVVQSGPLTQDEAHSQQAQPLIAGVDYDPKLILVVFNSNAELPPGIAHGTQQAALLPNSILRENREYESLTDAIATRHQLMIESQAYIGQCNFASFRVPDGIDSQQTLEVIQHEFGLNIKSAEFCGIANGAYVPNDPDYNSSTVSTGRQWYLHRINCEEAWDYSRGAEDVLVGVVDTGVNLTHQELIGQVLDPSVNWPDENLNVLSNNNNVTDNDGHGTGIAGVIAAIANNNWSIVGAAHLCKVIPIKIAESTAGATYDNMAEGCLLAAALGAKVVNLSWVSSGSSGAISAMVSELEAQGVLLVVAAGNDNSSNPYLPGKYPGCISVGATERDSDTPTLFTNLGPEIDVVAPGRYIYTARHSSPTSYYTWWGTSFAAPLVASGGALLYALNPEMPLEEVRYLLEETGVQVTGFHPDNVTRRLDLGAALSIGSIGAIEVPQLTKLVFVNNLAVEPRVGFGVTQVDVLLNGELYESNYTDPFEFSIDISGYAPGVINCDFTAYRFGLTESEHIPVCTDSLNSSALLFEDFDSNESAVLPLDIKAYSPWFLGAIKRLPPSGWTAREVSQNGMGSWHTAPEGLDATACMMIGGDSGYGAYETDVLISRRVDLREASAASLSFQTHYNIEAMPESDHGSVLVSKDYGRTFTQLEQSGTPIFYQGYQPEFSEETIDLSAFLGFQINIVWLFESNSTLSGEQVGTAAGWWIDDIEVNTVFEPGLLGLGEAQITPGTFLGSIPGFNALQISLPDAEYFDQIELLLDYEPIGQADPYDERLMLFAPRNEAVFTLEPTAQNRYGVLRITGSEPGGSQITRSEPLSVFNHFGDVNADGLIDEFDTAAFVGLIGLTATDDGYEQQFDTDQDGVISEADAAIIGYEYGPTN